MKWLQPVNGRHLLYNHIVGTGGIGSGIFFQFKSNDTLGRNESRPAALLPHKDYCKQHIILHYISILLGAKEGRFQSFPIGRVGKDRAGAELLEMMKDAGMDTRHVSIDDQSNTMFSVCFEYPDHSGGNITTDNSACSRVLPQQVSAFFGVNKEANGEIVLAAPEVPLITRMEMLKWGRQRKSLNVASILSSEVEEFAKMGGFEMLDLLSINIDEAKAIGGQGEAALENKVVVERCIHQLQNIHPQISVLITDGSRGSYCFSNNSYEFTPAPKVQVRSTAGAGDAFIAGTIAGLCCGLSLKKGMENGNFGATPLSSAVELGTLLAALSVTSHDTIHPAADASSLYNFASSLGVTFEDRFSKIFDGCSG